jgi:RHS repeat-associated protein
MNMKGTVDIRRVATPARQRRVASTDYYTYDPDNRLISVTTAAATHTFAYDYRSRRYYRNVTGANPEITYHIFDGGLSEQEYNELPTATSSPTVEYIRGKGMGGGVGGMVYSIRPPAPGSTLPSSILCSHSNHRGDIIARSDSTGSLTSYALYEAYGTRPYQWSDGTTGDPDRQKANTKEEESDLGLLNEGMRPRDLYTGTFLTRDPIGYADGPNVYCYVHCNPITKFDPLGLAGYGFEGTGNDKRTGGSFVSEIEKSYDGTFHNINGVATRTQKTSGALGGNGAQDRLDAMWKLFEA